jgi:putative oxygen-independent coproporphyrinogen III oxidase
MKPGIYIHLPFCSVHCVYCDFPISTRLSLSDRYYNALITEIRRQPPADVADTVYFGGGTPSLAPAKILKVALDSLEVWKQSEISLEANPDHITEEKLDEWLSLGVNRLSLGIQSTEPQVLKSMLRQHSPEDALQTLRMSRNSGFNNLNVDLVLGFPGQSVDGFSKGLEGLIELRPDHFSVYLLELHENAPLYRMIAEERLSPMEEADQLIALEQTVRLLSEAGYEQYEISNFALPGKTSNHNLKYWSDAPYYGYGAGACSYAKQYRTRNVSDVSAYIEAIERGGSALEEVIEENPEIRARNALIFGLRKVKGIDIALFQQKYLMSPQELFGSSFDGYITDGFLELSGNHLRLTRKGMLLSNEVLTSAV